MEMIRIRKFVLSLLVGLFFTGCTKTEVLSIVLKEDIVEVNSFKSSCSLVGSVNGESVISIDEESNTMVVGKELLYCSKVDANKLGEAMIEFSKGDVKSYQTINIVDKSAPSISAEDIAVVEQGNTYFNLESLIIVKDNFDADPSIEYEGSFDINTVGKYPIKVIAKDSSKNISEKSITIDVIEKQKEIVIVEVPPTNNPNNDSSTKPNTGGGTSSGSKPSKPSNSNTNSNTNNSKPNLPKPSNKSFMYVDGYNMDTAYKACVEYITNASKNGYGGTCSSIDQEGISKGYIATIN